MVITQPPDKDTARLSVDKVNALVTHSVRSEMKDWLNRAFMPAAAAVAMVSGATMLFEKLLPDDSPREAMQLRALICAAALFVLWQLARLSYYCCFAVRKGETYLDFYHPRFLAFRRGKDRFLRESEECLREFYAALAAYLTLPLFQPVLLPAAPFALGVEIPLSLAATGTVAASFWVQINHWMKRKPEWGPKDEAPTKPDEQTEQDNHYVETEIKVLREDVRDWQTRRFALVALAVAAVALGLSTSAKWVMGAVPSTGLALLAITALFRLSHIGHRANESASRALRDHHSPSFPWELDVQNWNNRHPTLWRLHPILRGAYSLLATIAVVSGICWGVSSYIELILLGLPFVLFVAVFILESESTKSA